MNKLIPLAACIAAMFPAAQAYAAGQAAVPQTPPTENSTVQAAPAQQPAAQAPQGVLPQVNVSGTRSNENEQRQLSTAAKIVIGREELDRNGDTSITEVLKRLPGVTIGGAPGRGGGGVRMRGMSGNYTQMLVNGERPPPGFSLESLPPEQVERIEVMRGPVAEHSTQAIAGTINIVLREGYRQKDRTITVADNIENGRHGANVSLTIPGGKDKLTWLLNGTINSNARSDESTTHLVETNIDGSPRTLQDISDRGTSRSTGFHLAPRVSYKFDNGDTLTYQQFVMANRSRSNASSDIAHAYGEAPEYTHLDSRSENTAMFTRGFGNWLHKMDKGAKLDVKFGFGGGRAKNEANRVGVIGAQENLWMDDFNLRQTGVSTGGKYTSPMGEGHLLAAGWDIESQSRNETRISVRNGQPLFSESGRKVSADTHRVAAFVQDEWDVSKQFSTYLGLRWEGIRTNSATVGYEVRNTSSVWSPVLHGVWRIPGREKDQVRASLTRSYKAPGINELIAAPFISTRNTRTSPDVMGNPDLKPELATGIDLAYERYIGRSGIISASAFFRKIDDLTRRETTERVNDRGELRWVSMPVNIGSATSRGIELEAKLQLVELVKTAPNIDLRANYSRFWSSVDGIPGPDNRLAEQPSQTGNLGIDYRMKELPLTLGGSINWTPDYAIQVNADEISRLDTKRQIDVYGLWKIDPRTQLRISANNVGPRDYDTSRDVVVRSGPGMAPLYTHSSDTISRTYTTFGIRYETKF
ncbi:TonB-dependent receptor plug domain-containing protein [Pseudoduganella sp. GCM10020061]|uniref:TonB-dependent receptor plug domain-containing protein n=1 Tax=Pseudoduganella sp. GCM10020061 TaxID=3317345 RepID=UPI0036283825